MNFHTYAIRVAKELQLPPEHPISILASAYEAIGSSKDHAQQRLRLNMLAFARSIGMQVGQFDTLASILVSVYDNNTAWDELFSDIVAAMIDRHQAEIAGARIIALVAGADLQRDIERDDQQRGPLQ